jgi:hypothetical protein
MTGKRYGLLILVLACIALPALAKGSDAAFTAQIDAAMMKMGNAMNVHPAGESSRSSDRERGRTDPIVGQRRRPPAASLFSDRFRNGCAARYSRADPGAVRWELSKL